MTAWIEFLDNEVVDPNRITQYTPDLPQSQVDTTIAQAFQIYSDVIPLDFKQISSGTADIMILFKGGCESGLSKRCEKHPILSLEIVTWRFYIHFFSSAKLFAKLDK